MHTGRFCDAGEFLCFVKELLYRVRGYVVILLLSLKQPLNGAIFLPLFVLALALTWLYEKTDNLLAPITAHALFNAVNFTLLLAHSSTPNT